MERTKRKNETSETYEVLSRVAQSIPGKEVYLTVGRTDRRRTLGRKDGKTDEWIDEGMDRRTDSCAR